MARQQKQPTWSMRYLYTTWLSQSVVSTPISSDANNAKSRSFARTQWSAHTRNSLTRMTSWDKPDLTYGIQSRVGKRQFVMRKVKSTILVFRQSTVNALAPSSLYSILAQFMHPRLLSCICVLLFTAMNVWSLTFCVWEWRRYTIQHQ